MFPKWLQTMELTQTTWVKYKNKNCCFIIVSIAKYSIAKVLYLDVRLAADRSRRGQSKALPNNERSNDVKISKIPARQITKKKAGKGGYINIYFCVYVGE